MPRTIQQHYILNILILGTSTDLYGRVTEFIWTWNRIYQITVLFYGREQNLIK